MSAASYNRGSRLVSKVADMHMKQAHAQADRAAEREELERLRGALARAERELARARRCLTSARVAHDMRIADLQAEMRTSKLAVSILCRIAFPADTDLRDDIDEALGVKP